MRRFTTHLYKSVSALVLAISFFFVTSIPVLADYDYQVYPVENWQILSYEYWYRMGYSSLETLSSNQVISIPDFRTDYGATNYSYQCRLSGTTYSCAAYAPDGTYQGTYDWSITRSPDVTVTNIIKWGYEIPWMSGTYIHDTSHVSSNRDIYIGANSSTYISFYSTTNPYRANSNYQSDAVTNNFMQIWSRNGRTGYTVTNQNSSALPNAYFYVLRIDNPNNQSDYISINFPTFTNSTKIIPMYVGSGNDIDDSNKQILGIPTTTETALTNISSKIDGMYTNLNTVAQTSMSTNNSLISGNPTSQAAQSALNNSNTTLNNRVDQMNTIETEYNSDLNAALDDIDLSTDLVQHTGFTNAALWVSAQFNRLVLGTPFELVITFSLITGLSLVLIGKMRG